jgi:hypothetical protein
MLDVIVYGLDDAKMTPDQFYDLYTNQLTVTERKYYDAWAAYKRFKVKPWTFFNARKITRDQILMLQHMENQYNQRQEVKKQKDALKQQQDNFNNFMVQNMGQNRSNKTKSVL